MDVLENGDCRGKDCDGDDERGDGIRNGKPDCHEDEADDDARRDEHVGQRVLGVRHQNRALEELALLVLEARHTRVDAQRRHHHDYRHERELGRCLAREQLLNGAPADLACRAHKQDADEHTRESLVFGMPIGMAHVGRTCGNRNTQQRHNIARGVEQRVDAICPHGTGGKRVAREDFRERDAQVEAQHQKHDTPYLDVSLLGGRNAVQLAFLHSHFLLLCEKDDAKGRFPPLRPRIKKNRLKRFRLSRFVQVFWCRRGDLNPHARKIRH